MFGFATNVNHENLSNFYANNLDFFLKHTLLFKEKLLPSINTNLGSICLPFNIQKDNVNTDSNPLGDFDLKKIYLSDHLSITYREFACLNYFSKGYTCKEVAQKLNISHNTVETHLNHAKLKLGNISKAKILDLLNGVSFLH